MTQISASQHLPVRSYKCEKEIDQNALLQSMVFGQKLKTSNSTNKVTI